MTYEEHPTSLRTVVEKSGFTPAESPAIPTIDIDSLNLDHLTVGELLAMLERTAKAPELTPLSAAAAVWLGEVRRRLASPGLLQGVTAEALKRLPASVVQQQPLSPEEMEAAGRTRNVEEIRTGRGDKLRAILSANGCDYVAGTEFVRLSQLKLDGYTFRQFAHILRDAMEATMRVIGREANGTIIAELEEPDWALRGQASCLALELNLMIDSRSMDGIFTRRHLGHGRQRSYVLCLR